MNKFSREQYKIVITGQGYVGLVLGACLAEKGYKILGLDNDQGKINQLSKGMCSIYEPGLQEIIQKNINNGNLFFSTDCQNAYQDAEYIFICVGTPEMDNGCANLNYVVACALQIAEYVTRDCTIIIKSTVPIGTNSQIESYIRENLKHDVNINVVSNPEFLSQGSAVSDMMNGRIVIGTDDEEAKQKVSSLYEPFKCPVVFASRKVLNLLNMLLITFCLLRFRTLMKLLHYVN
mgnify:FL=1